MAEHLVPPGTCILFFFFHYQFFCYPYAAEILSPGSCVVNFIILAWFPFFAPPMRCILSTCFLKLFSSILASLATTDVLNLSFSLFQHFGALGDLQLSYMTFKSMNLLHLVDTREEGFCFTQQLVHLPLQRQFPLKDLLFPLALL